MSYQSVDTLQKAMTYQYFNGKVDSKKAAGRSLGTIVEIITFYLLKDWGLETSIAIEKPLFEYGSDDISHNVEFTLHGSTFLETKTFNAASVTTKKLYKEAAHKIPNAVLKTDNIIRNKVIRNACTIAENEDCFINAYYDSANADNTDISYYKLIRTPYAMFECKRVGVEDGMKKGPQTIEKAKQGSYVAKTVSSLQKVKNSNGDIIGVIENSDGNIEVIGDYYTKLREIITSQNVEYLRNLILTVGVVSNHGNWFTSGDQNKEIKVLAQSYDWLLFLTDEGITAFVEETILNPVEEYKAIKEAFDESYPKGERGNVFTKVKTTVEANEALIAYFANNREVIKGWFNVITPVGGSVQLLKEELEQLKAIDWDKVY